MTLKRLLKRLAGHVTYWVLEVARFVAVELLGLRWRPGACYLPQGTKLMGHSLQGEVLAICRSEAGTMILLREPDGNIIQLDGENRILSPDWELFPDLRHLARPSPPPATPEVKPGH